MSQPPRDIVDIITRAARSPIVARWNFRRDGPEVRVPVGPSLARMSASEIEVPAEGPGKPEPVDAVAFTLRRPVGLSRSGVLVGSYKGVEIRIARLGGCG